MRNYESKAEEEAVINETSALILTDSWKSLRCWNCLLHKRQNQLDDIYRSKAADSLCDLGGERRTKLCFMLQVRDSRYYSISELSADDIIMDDHKTTNNCCYNVCKLLYTSRFILILRLVDSMNHLKSSSLQ